MTKVGSLIKLKFLSMYFTLHQILEKTRQFQIDKRHLFIDYRHLTELLEMRNEPVGHEPIAQT